MGSLLWLIWSFRFFFGISIIKKKPVVKPVLNSVCENYFTAAGGVGIAIPSLVKTNSVNLSSSFV